VPSVRNDDPVTDHDAADPRDWGMHINDTSLIVQTLQQAEGFAITMLALDQTGAETDE
jgi:hypothetical protein